MLVLVDTNTLGIKIIKEITARIAAAACMVPIAFFAPGFARESAAVALPSGKLHAGIDKVWRQIQGAQRIRGHTDVIGARRAQHKLLRGLTIAIMGAQSPP